MNGTKKGKWNKKETGQMKDRRDKRMRMIKKDEEK